MKTWTVNKKSRTIFHNGQPWVSYSNYFEFSKARAFVNALNKHGINSAQK